MNENIVLSIPIPCSIVSLCNLFNFFYSKPFSSDRALSVFS